eukprot:TRINITY_DN8204_c0_g1_i2.p1 TRINITY_DN8204_c0_g1~~TRINITY_DN8204_c0_g1_i2.p1  ORF type:complete len:344 (-),score=25.81 TRINITY_DN8204_c0_g1_i2:343-1374(-)
MFCSSRDQLGQLPDSLLLLIFNKVGDVKALGRCCVMSKRFNALVPQVDNAVVKVDCVISGEDGSLDSKGKGMFANFVRVMLGSILKPLQVLQRIISGKKEILADVSHHSPSEVLKNFREIRHLGIELPGAELGVEKGGLLRWKAEFGNTLESCVIFGAGSVENRASKNPGKRKLYDAESSEDSADGGNIPESLYVGGGLKLRVVWSISSLIAASARHYLLQEIIHDHPTLKSLILTDADGQGTLYMSAKQLIAFRNKPLAPSGSSQRTQVPALNMKLRYAPILELSCGTVMQGATLVTITPTDQKAPPRENEVSFTGAFERPIEAAAEILARRRTYLLEMNSF